MEGRRLSAESTPGCETREPGLWLQLRRRRVTRTVVSYVSLGFAVLEATWYLVPR
jgi:hypothetical protein